MIHLEVEGFVRDRKKARSDLGFRGNQDGFPFPLHCCLWFFWFLLDLHLLLAFHGLSDGFGWLRLDAGRLFQLLIGLDLALDEMEELRMAFEEVAVAKNIFGGLLSRFMEAIHVELAYEAVDVPVPEVFGEDALLELLDVLDGELFAVGGPLYDLLIFFVLSRNA